MKYGAPASIAAARMIQSTNFLVLPAMAQQELAAFAFSMALRTYGPGEAITKQTWQHA